MEKKVFFSSCASLIVSVTKGNMQRGAEGEFRRVNEKLVQFQDNGDGGYGRYMTDDKDEIAYLEKRAAEVGDVFGHEEFTKRTTPPEIRLKQMERELEESNKIIADMQKKRG